MDTAEFIRLHGDPLKARPDIDLTPEAEKVITCEIIAESGCVLDGERIPRGQKVKVSVKQWRALSLYLKFIDGPATQAPVNWTPPTAPHTPNPQK
jgi:hypothetical protein